MAANGSYSITVSAVDKTSGVFKNINKNLAAMNRPFNNLQKQINQFDKLSGLKSLRQQASNLVQPIERAGKGIASMFGVGT